MQRVETSVLIIGGGGAGLTASLLLSQLDSDMKDGGRETA